MKNANGENLGSSSTIWAYVLFMVEFSFHVLVRNQLFFVTENMYRRCVIVDAAFNVCHFYFADVRVTSRLGRRVSITLLEMCLRTGAGRAPTAGTCANSAAMTATGPSGSTRWTMMTATASNCAPGMAV